MAFTIKWVTPSGPGSLTTDLASDALMTAQAAAIAGELVSVVDSNGADLTIEILERLATAAARNA